MLHKPGKITKIYSLAQFLGNKSMNNHTSTNVNTCSRLCSVTFPLSFSSNLCMKVEIMTRRSYFKSKIPVVGVALCVPHCFFLFWGSVRYPLIFNVLHQHRPHTVPDLHANTSPASTPKHMNPELHANRSPASTAKQTHHLHCTQLNYKTWD